MKLVVDTNQLQSPRLRSFFSDSKDNCAVLTDFAAMESYKDDTLSSIFKSMEIVSQFPLQVLVLKGSAKVVAMNGRLKGLQRRLIDETQTREFSKYVQALKLAKHGNQRIRLRLLELGRSANEHLDKMLKDAEEMPQIFAQFGKQFSKQERSILRNRDSYTSEMVEKLMRTVLEIYNLVFQTSSLIRKMPTREELPNTFPFRVLLAGYLLAINREAFGGVGAIRAERLRNDLVDIAIAAYGTYFDGLLTEDIRAIRIFEETCLFLSGAMGAEVPAIYKLFRQ